MIKKSHHFVTRPSNAVHGCPLIVFNRENHIHFPLTLFGKLAAQQVSSNTVRTYLYDILPFFDFLEEDEWQVRNGSRWEGEPDQVRRSVIDYLAQKLQCKIREHRLGFQLVGLTKGTRSSVGVFLSGLKLFYRLMRQSNHYAHNNPLVDGTSSAIRSIEEQLDLETEPPRMPDCSGVVEPFQNSRSKKRLSDSYFKLEGEDWVPQIVDDVTLPARIFEGGCLVGWGQREIIITRLLFEAGPRISEVVGLTLGDWAARGLLQQATAFSKGSNGKRVKFLRFSSDTAKLLRRYFNTERLKLDPTGYSIDTYIRLAKQKQVDLYTVPLFLSIRRTQLNAKTYRDRYWNPACKAANIDADVHQARHWYVTMAVRQIYETSTKDGEVERKLRELIEYMKWKSGKETLEAYEHYFDATRHAEVQDAVFARMDETLRLRLRESRRQLSSNKKIEVPSDWTSQTTSLPDPDFEYLRRLGGYNAS